MQGAVHLDGGAATLGIALGVMGVPSGEQRPFREHGKEQARPGGELFDVQVAAVLPGLRTVLRPSDAKGSPAGTAPAGSGPSTAPPRRSSSSSRRSISWRKAAGRGDADCTHERRSRHAHSGEVRRLGKPVGYIPVDDVGRQEHVAEEPEAGDDGREPPPSRVNVQDVAFQQVAGLGPLDVDWAGKRMDHVQVPRC